MDGEYGKGNFTEMIFCKAPESLRDKVYSAASDIWSYGVVMYECINRTTPFPDMDAFTAGSQIAWNNLTLDLPDPEKWPLCHRIMKQAFSRNPNDRPTADTILKLFETDRW